MIEYNHPFFIGGLAGIVEHTAVLPFRSLLERQILCGDKSRARGNLFVGIVPQTFNVIASHGWYYYCFEKSKSQTSHLYTLLYASTAKIGHEILSIPLDTVRLQMNCRQFTFMQSVKYITETKGWTGFFRGMVPTLLTGVPQTCIEFTIFNTFREDLHPLVLGGIAGFLSTVCISPIDRYKMYNQYHQQLSVKEVWKKWKHDGQYFRGIWLRTIQAAIGFGTFETIQNYFNSNNK